MREHEKKNLSKRDLIIVFMTMLLVAVTMPIFGDVGTQPPQNFEISSALETEHGLTLSDMIIKITSQEHVATFQLYDTVAAKELYEQLPLELELRNFRDAQWMFWPPERLNVTPQEAYHDGIRGELSYYEPWGNAFMLYRDFYARDQMHRLGINLTGIDEIANMSGSARVEIAESGQTQPTSETSNSEQLGKEESAMANERNILNSNDILTQTINFTLDGRVNMRTYIHTNGDGKRIAIIVLPGGAYGFLSAEESEPVALTFFEKGFSAFVLNYSVGDHSVYPNPLEDISKAIWEVRRNADDWGINPDAIVLMGFSAGSGIAAMSATQWNTPGLSERLGIPEDGIKPNAAVMGYGAASNSELLDTPGVYVPDILGKIARDRTPELDVVNYVGAHTPPLFIWHNRYDRLVPAINPIMMAEAMQKNELPYELHIFQEGHHGMSVGNNAPGKSLEGSEYPSVDLWVTLCENWLNSLFIQ